MPYARPTLSGLYDQAIQDITTSGVPGLDGLLRNAVLRVLAWVMAALAYSQYGYLDWIAEESVPFTATDERLEAWAALIGVFRKDSTPASGTGATFNGAIGLTVRQNDGLTRQDGTPYIASADATVDPTGTVIVPVIAAVNGAATNCDAGTPMTLDTPPAGINAGGVTSAALVGGADQETDDELRTRMLAKYREPPKGGTAGDYLEWALSVPGCTRAWIVPMGYGPGSVVVYPMFDDVEADHGGFPQGTDGGAVGEKRIPVATGDQSLVAEAIWLVQPLTVLVYVLAPTAAPLNVTIANLSPADLDTQGQVLAALEDMFLAVGAVNGTVYPSDIYDAVARTPGVERFTVQSPAAPFTAPTGALPVLGVFTVV
jgi:uncharacterized phage protein gp47/JayE